MRTSTAATAALDAVTTAAIAGRNVLRCAGYAFDAHSGLYYLSKRYYDPATCQFITKDPAKADGEESAYQYCGGDPVGKVDPSGEWPDTWHRSTAIARAEALGVSRSLAKMFGSGAYDADQGSYGWMSNRWIHFNKYMRGKYSIRKGQDSFNSTPYDATVPDSRIEWAIACRKKAEKRWGEGKKAAAMWWLGIGVHALQDVYAHGQYSGESEDFYIPHWWTLDQPTWRSPWEKSKGYKAGWRARQATAATTRYLKEFFHWPDALAGQRA